jgi:hypothetical protein
MAKFQAIIYHRSFVEIKMLGLRYVAGAIPGKSEKENHGKWQVGENKEVWKLAKNKILPAILAYVNRSIGPTIKIILSVQDNFCRTFATVRRTFGMTVPMDTNCAPLLDNLFIYSYEVDFVFMQGFFKK